MSKRSEEQKKIIKEIYKFQYKKDRIRIEEAIATVAPDILGIDHIEALEYAERNKQNIWDRLISRLDFDRSKGTYPTFQIIEQDRFIFRWFPKILKDDSSSLRRKKIRLSKRGIILDFLDNKIDNRDYEAIGCVICLLSGAKKYKLTKQSDEEGIDFLALIPSYGKSHLFPHSSKEIRIVGQSKYWKNPIPKTEIKSLIATLTQVRQHHPKMVEEVLPTWFLTAKGPIIGVMLAHNGGQKGAYERADEHGIILADSFDVAEIVTLSKEWRISKGSSKVESFFKDKIEIVLATA